MSVSVSVVALKQITDEEYKILVSYNTMYDNDIKPSKELRQRVRDITGLTLNYDEPLPLNDELQAGSCVEIRADSIGDAEYGDGMLIPMEYLPPGTVALRVYMS